MKTHQADLAGQRLVAASRTGNRATRRFLAVIGFGLALTAVLPAAMLPGSRPKKWPANPERHTVTIDRKAEDPKEAALIAARGYTRGRATVRPGAPRGRIRSPPRPRP